MKEDSLIEKFTGLFKGVLFSVAHKQCITVVKQPSNTSIDSSEKDLKKMLLKAKKDLSKAKKSHKHNKMSSDELFEWQYRVSELQQEIERLDESTEESDI